MVRVLSALVLLLSSTAALAQAVPAVPQPTAQAVLIYPLTIITKQNLDFGYLAVNAAGTAIVDPDRGALSTTGGVVALGGNPRPAIFVGASRSASVVNLKVPNQPIRLTRVGGTETMLLRDFKLQGVEKRALARMESFEFNVGGTLVVAAGQAEGVYAGTFDVTVHYP